MRSIKDRLDGMDACPEAVAWADTYQDPAVAWTGCPRGDWMLWLLGRLDVVRQDLVLAACECARLALSHARDPEALAAIEAAEGWAAGRVVMADLRRAADAAAAAAAAAADADAAASAAAYTAAYAAYAAAAAAYAAHAAYAAAVAYAADAANTAAANAANAAAYAAAANAAADAAAYAAYDATSRESTLATCANIVRRHFPVDKFLAIWGPA